LRAMHGGMVGRLESFAKVCSHSPSSSSFSSPFPAAGLCLDEELS
jgi:hypothetical protein